MKVSIKNKNLYIEKINRAEELLKELKNIFAWDLNGELEVEMEITEKGTDTESPKDVHLRSDTWYF